MDNCKLIALLKDKAEQGKLAPFYIIQNHPHLSPFELYRWMNELLTQFLQREGRQTASELTAIGDVDTLILNTEEKQYKVNQINSILQQLHYPSFSGNRRYWVICDAHKCTTQIYNKLLKTLEEPPSDTVIFLLDSLQSAILPTVKSRAATLRISLPKTAQSKFFQFKGKLFASFLQDNFAQLTEIWNEELPVSELAQKIHSAQKVEEFTKAALAWWKDQVYQFEQCQHFLQSVQFLQEQREFHGRHQIQLVLIIQQIQDIQRQCLAR